MEVAADRHEQLSEGLFPVRRVVERIGQTAFVDGRDGG
jgi:hypothetical protein